MSEPINYDVHTEEDLKKHCSKSEELADQFLDACKANADAKIYLNKLYVKALKAGEVKESAAMEKAIATISQSSPEANAEYEVFLKSEMLIKGLEQVLETRGKTVTVHQSLMKNRQAKQV